MLEIGHIFCKEQSRDIPEVVSEILTSNGSTSSSMSGIVGCTPRTFTRRSGIVHSGVLGTKSRMALCRAEQRDVMTSHRPNLDLVSVFGIARLRVARRRRVRSG